MKKWIPIPFVIALVLSLTACGDSSVWKLPSQAKGRGLAFSPDGKALIVRYETGNDTVTEWRETPAGKTRWQIQSEGYPPYQAGAAFNSSGDQLALVEPDRISLYTAEGALQGAFQVEDSHLVDVSRSQEDGWLILREELTSPLTSLYFERRGPEGNILTEPVFLVNEPELNWWRPFTPDGKWLAYPIAFHIVAVYDVSSGKKNEWDLREALSFYDEGDPRASERRAIFAGAVRLDGQEIALGLNVQQPGQPAVMLIDAQTGDVVDELLPAENEGDLITGLAYSPDGQRLAASINRFPDRALTVFDLGDGSSKTFCDGEGCCAQHPTFSPDGAKLAVLCDRQVKFWDMSE